jgi:hypothetical protein
MLNNNLFRTLIFPFFCMNVKVGLLRPVNKLLMITYEPTSQEVTRGWRKLQIGELSNLSTYSAPNILGAGYLCGYDHTQRKDETLKRPIHSQLK